MIFINGCFWHGHIDCKSYVLPKSNVEFWEKKIQRNKKRDIEVQQKLASLGWHCITIWECQLKPKVREQTLEALVNTLHYIYMKDRTLKDYEIPDESYVYVAAEDVKEYEE